MVAVKLEIIEEILKHFDLWQHQEHGPAMRMEDKMVEETVSDYIEFEIFSDMLIKAFICFL